MRKRGPPLAAAVRGLLYPMRWATVTLPRGSLFRSACVPFVKAASRRPALLASLPEIRPLDRPDISFETIDSWVMDDVYWFGVQGYEGVLAETWVDLCRRSSSVLEIGANIGLYSVIGGKAARGVYTAVEPVPHVALVLRANLRRNGLTRVEVLEGAAIPDAQPQRVMLNVADEGRAAPTGAHLLQGVEIAHRKSSSEVTVDGFPITTLVCDRDLIKIDAEGIEHALLRAVFPILLQHRPTIVVEMLPEAAQLATVIRELATAAPYVINVVPGYGSSRIVTIAPEEFNAEVPRRFNSKDIILSSEPLQDSL